MESLEKTTLERETGQKDEVLDATRPSSASRQAKPLSHEKPRHQAEIEDR